MTEGPEKQVYFGNGFGIPDGFPKGRVGWDVGDASKGVIAQ
jgi:hypothetical protein